MKIKKCILTFLIMVTLGATQPADATNYFPAPQKAPPCGTPIHLSLTPATLSEPQCALGRMPISFYVNRKVDLSKFRNHQSNGVSLSYNGKYKKYRDYSGHAGGYWKIVHNNSRDTPIHTTTKDGKIIEYGKWGPYPYSEENSLTQ